MMGNSGQQGTGGMAGKMGGMLGGGMSRKEQPIPKNNPQDWTLCDSGDTTEQWGPGGAASGWGSLQDDNW